MSRSRLAGFLLLSFLYAGAGFAYSFAPRRGTDDPMQGEGMGAGEVVEASPVSGTVKAGGQPLRGATVRFQSDKGHTVSVKTGPDGSFSLPAKGLPAGDVKITIEPAAPKAQEDKAAPLRRSP